MDGRRAVEVEDPTTIPLVTPRTGAVADHEGAGPDALPRRWAWFAGLVGPAVAAYCIAVEPPSPTADTADPTLGMILFLGLVVAWVGAALRATQRRRAALEWAGAAGALSLALSLTCPTSGHHTEIGAWWFGQLAVCTAALAAAVVGRVRTRVSPPA